ncbi:Fic family protein [Sulfurovum sp.]|jgi:Fic family protein|uniref:Fic family protein n=1 Tax=Sulfurovum sp. TaxID=1969726 RepID=UPI002A366EFA|nr:Fic family protein [Sulfurovum sp.]MDY0402790.1 Fic family protein [Sulfurovum sp.]
MGEIKKWIWQHERYPRFTYDHMQVAPALFQVSKNVGVLEGTIRHLDKNDVTSVKVEAALNEIISTSEIEGEILRRDSVRSSVRKRLDETFDPAEDRSSRQTDTLTDILIDSSYNHAPLTVERLHAWHHALFSSGYSGMNRVTPGRFRDHDDMSVVSGPIGKEKVHYIALPASRIDKDIDALLEYCNHSKDDPFVKSALAHLWFVTIHPYDDGNGRIARALTNNVLSRELGLDHKYYSISAAVNQERKGYYEVLEKSQNLIYNRAFDLTPWILWHTHMIDRAIDISLEHIEVVISKTKFWDRVRSESLNEKQLKVIHKMLDKGEHGFEGGLTNKKYRAMTKVSTATAARHIKELVAKGVIHEVKGHGGRSTRYEISFS